MPDIQQQLWDIEQIKLLKARYVRYGDTMQWDKFRTLFTENYVHEVEGVCRSSPDQPNYLLMEGLSTVMSTWESMLKNSDITMNHQVSMPEITITSPTTATGIWALHDIIRLPTCLYKGWGHYNEEYVKVNGEWKISRSRTTRVRVEEQWLKT